MKLYKQLAAAAVLAFAGQAALAGPVYSYKVENPTKNVNNQAGHIDRVATAYNQNTGRFSWTHTISDKGHEASNAFWLVVSDGPNPKNNVNKYTIFYGDLAKKRVTAYEYSGSKKVSSFESGAYLGTFGLQHSRNAADDAGKFNFSLNAENKLNDASDHAGLQNPGKWVGLSFQETTGIWFHPLLNANFVYNGKAIAGLDYDVNGFFDTNNTATTSRGNPSNPPTVSEAPTLGMMVLGLAMMLRRRKSQ